MGEADGSGAAARKVRPRKAASRGLARVNLSRKKLRFTRSDHFILKACSTFMSTVRARRRFLHRFFDGLEEAVVGAYTGSLVRHKVARSVEVDLLRGVLEPGRRSGTGKVS